MLYEVITGDREMAYMLYLAGFDVKDVHMTDLARAFPDTTIILNHFGGPLGVGLV